VTIHSGNCWLALSALEDLGDMNWVQLKEATELSTQQLNGAVDYLVKLGLVSKTGSRRHYIYSAVANPRPRPKPRAIALVVPNSVFALAKLASE
jgi:hypothetical protein